VARGNEDRPASSRPDWLARGQWKRQRRWAFEQQLLSPGLDSDPAGRLGELDEQLDEARTAVAGLENELWRQKAILAGLTQERAGFAPADGRPEKTVDQRPRTVVPATWSAAQHVLMRCEGFAVQSASGREIGVVTGLRFGIRIDRPDVLELDVGRFRERIVLVSVDEIETISAEQAKVVLRHDPLHHHDLAREVLTRIRAHINPPPTAH
jgi:hypothetical protein